MIVNTSIADKLEALAADIRAQAAAPIATIDANYDARSLNAILNDVYARDNSVTLTLEIRRFKNSANWVVEWSFWDGKDHHSAKSLDVALAKLAAARAPAKPEQPITDLAAALPPLAEPQTAF